MCTHELNHRTDDDRVVQQPNARRRGAQEVFFFCIFWGGVFFGEPNIVQYNNQMRAAEARKRPFFPFVEALSNLNDRVAPEAPACRGGAGEGSVK